MQTKAGEDVRKEVVAITFWWSIASCTSDILTGGVVCVHLYNRSFVHLFTGVQRLDVTTTMLDALFTVISIVIIIVLHGKCVYILSVLFVTRDDNGLKSYLHRNRSYFLATFLSRCLISE